MVIREALPEEHPILSRIAFESKASHGYSGEFMEACRAELTYSFDQIDSESFHFMVAVGDDGIEGFAAVEVLSSNECELEALFVLPEFAGRGTGRTLMQSVLDRAFKLGLNNMTIQSDPGAVEFYRSFGAIQSGESPSGSIPGRMLPELCLELSAGLQG